MNKLFLTIVGAVYAAVASAATLPDWAIGTFKGSVENWCEVYDDPYDMGPWYGTANLTVAANGKLTGEMRFGALKCTPLNKYSIQSIGDGEVHIVAKFKFYEPGELNEQGFADIYIRKDSAGKVTLEYTDADQLGDGDEYCPIEGTLAKTASAIVIPDVWKKARTLTGVAYGPWTTEKIFGTVTIKCGKANAKTGQAKVSMIITPLSGKKRSYKAQTVDVTAEEIFIGWNDALFSLREYNGETLFAGDVSLNGDGYYELEINNGSVVGGLLTKEATFNFGELSSVNDALGDDFVIQYGYTTSFEDVELYSPLAFTMAGKKWNFAKAATMRYKKCPANATCIGDWTIDATKGKTNIPGLRLTYNPKTGVFKGSFKLYTFFGKKYTANVAGMVVDGIGYGQATIKKPAVTWSVSVE